MRMQTNRKRLEAKLLRFISTVLEKDYKEKKIFCLLCLDNINILLCLRLKYNSNEEQLASTAHSYHTLASLMGRHLCRLTRRSVCSSSRLAESLKIRRVDQESFFGKSCPLHAHLQRQAAMEARMEQPQEVPMRIQVMRK